MDTFFTKTFTRFLSGFLAILGVAFAVMGYASTHQNNVPQPIDNVALPR